MHYYIDGYNFLFRFSSEKSGFTHQRELMIQELDQKADALKLEITLVFDAHFQIGEASRSHFKCLEVLFTAFGESADDLILQEIAQERAPDKITVVTSDKKLAWFARRCDAKTESVEHFRSWLNRRHQNRLRRDANPKPVKVAPKPAENAIPVAKPTQKPSENKSVEACFDYYLDVFQDRLKVLPEEKKRHPKVTEDVPEKGKTREEASHSDFERWLKAFEEGT